MTPPPPRQCAEYFKKNKYKITIRSRGNDGTFIFVTQYYTILGSALPRGSMGLPAGSQRVTTVMSYLRAMGHDWGEFPMLEHFTQ